ncbi:hypothetical protein T08_7875 [Trichinella sp. T8]|nr:hypothetical protein T08_7875 [Trichinella sp. T8]
MTHLAFGRDITAHFRPARPVQLSRPGPRIYLPHSLQSSRGQFLQSIFFSSFNNDDTFGIWKGHYSSFPSSQASTALKAWATLPPCDCSVTLNK